MKKMIPLFAMLFAVVATASAFPYGSSGLEISVEEFGRFTIEVNGQAYPTTNGTLQLEGVAPGNYQLRVVKHERMGRGYGAPVRHRVMYQGNVFVPRHTIVQGKLNRHGMRFLEVGPPPSAMAPCVEPVAYYEGPMMMHHTAFQDLIFSIRSTPFDRTKVQIAKSALSRNLVSTQQVAMIMRELSFDSYKLDISKFAFGSCIDPENYHLLTREFTFDSNARALLQYIH